MTRFTKLPIPAASPVKGATVSPLQTPMMARATTEQIAKRAYELFLARGAEHGHDQEDWLQAERELSLGRYN